MMQRANPQADIGKQITPNSPEFPVSSALPPFNLDAEQGFLGSLLLWNNVLEDVDFLRADHFFDPLHIAIFELAVATIRQGRKASPITLKDSFINAAPVNHETSAVAYLGVLAARACQRASAPDYARTIVDLATRRSLIVIGEDIALSACEVAPNFPPSDLIEEAEARLLALVDKAEQERIVFADVIGGALASALKAAGGTKTGLPTGFHDLDAKMGWLQPTDLIILAGRPSMGKSAMCVNIAVNVAKRGCPVGFFSLEMSAEQIGMRVLGDYVDISPEKLRKGEFDKSRRDALQELALAAKKLPIEIDARGGLTITQVAARARRMKRQQGIQLLVVDYLQLMTAGRKTENRVQDVSAITMGLKALAKELGIPVLALSQLNRSVDARENKRPHLADLRESGSIEQDADIVLFVYREEYYVEREQPSVTDYSAYVDWQNKLKGCAGKAEVIIGKARHGPTGTVAMAFSGEMTRFADLAREVARS